MSNRGTTPEPPNADPPGRGSRRGFTPARIAAIAAMVVGGMLVFLGAGYLIFAQVERSRLPRLDGSIPSGAQVLLFGTPTTSASGSSTTPSAAGGATPSVSASEYASINAVGLPNPQYWSSPEFAGNGPYESASIPAGFQLVSASPSSPLLNGTGATATAIAIPAIGLRAGVKDLAVVEVKDIRKYQTPVDIVGHIDGTPNAGADGNSWYFGHLESPFMGEGNVFRDLPKVVDAMKHDPVNIIISTTKAQYLYRVIRTQVIPRDQLHLYDSQAPEITLVTCVPTKVYDHRLLVTGRLLAFRPLPS